MPYKKDGKHRCTRDEVDDLLVRNTNQYNHIKMYYAYQQAEVYNLLVNTIVAELERRVMLSMAMLEAEIDGEQ